MPCEQGHKMERLLNWPEIEFNTEAFAACDRLVAANFGAEHAKGLALAGEAEPVPEPRTLWGFTPNPHAHAPAKNCYSDQVMKGLEHGTRNAFWMAFSGSGAHDGAEREL
eukprot:SAG22_NODE_22_length_31438_cov_47.016529_15_plen_110_part_00